MTKIELKNDSVVLVGSSSTTKIELAEAPATVSVEGQAARISIVSSKMEIVLSDLEDALRGVLHSPALAPDCKSAAPETPELPPAVDYLRILGNNTHAQLVRLHGLASRLAICGDQSKADSLTPPLNEASDQKTLEAQNGALGMMARFQCGQLTSLAAILSPILLPDSKGDDSGKIGEPLPPLSVAAEALMDTAAQFERNVAHTEHLISLINMR